MFDSIYSTVVTPSQFFLMAAVSLICGLAYSWIISYRIRAQKRFFMVTALIPFIVAAVITFVNGNIGAGVAIGGAFARLAAMLPDGIIIWMRRTILRERRRVTEQIHPSQFRISRRKVEQAAAPVVINFSFAIMMTCLGILIVLGMILLSLR